MIWNLDEPGAGRAGKVGVVVLGLFLLGIVAYRMKGHSPDPAPVRKTLQVNPRAMEIQVGTTRQAVPPPQAAPETIGRALNDIAMSNLIQNLRVASVQGNQASARAALGALKRRPQEARDVLRNELARTNDESLALFYKVTLQELGQ